MLNRIIVRVLVGLLIGIGMFYFRSAHAQTCPSGQVPQWKITECGIGGNTLTCAEANTTGPDATIADSVVAANTPNGTPSGINGTQQYWCGAVTVNNSGPTFRRAQKVSGNANGSSCFRNPTYFATATLECVTPPPVCPTGGSVYKYFAPSEGVPAETCDSQCNFTLVEGNDAHQFKIETGGTFTGNSALYAETGQNCTATVQTPAPAAPAPLPSAAGNITPDQSLAAGRKGCGYVDGAYKCLGEPTGNGKCTRTPNGGGICVTDITPNNVAVIKDAVPNTGTPAPGYNPTAAVENDKITITAKRPAPGGTTTTETITARVFSPAQMAAATNQGDGTEQGEEGGEPCGAPGQPVCAVKVDETGTPDLPADTLGAASDGFQTDALGKIQDLQTGPPELEGAGSDLVSMIPQWGGSCTSLTIANFRGSDVTFPGARGCTIIDKIKAILAYLLAAVTAFYCIRRFLEAQTAAAT